VSAEIRTRRHPYQQCYHLSQFSVSLYTHKTKVVSLFCNRSYMSVYTLCVCEILRSEFPFDNLPKRCLTCFDYYLLMCVVSKMCMDRFRFCVCISYSTVPEMLRIVLHGTCPVFIHYITEIKINKNTLYKNTNHQQIHKESFIINRNTLLHVSILRNHLQGELTGRVTLSAVRARTADSSRLQKQCSTQSTAHSHSTVKCDPSVTVTTSSP
jgi:hypothetical protein